ncbi:protein of unknown function [Streptomyces murinus]
MCQLRFSVARTAPPRITHCINVQGCV